MQSQFKQKLAFIAQKKMTRKFILVFLLTFQAIYIFAEPPPKATWYRYYDSKGIANISTSVTPNHIRHGYEALDRNMQVIQRNRAYNTEADIKKAPLRAAQARQNAADLKLKTAYTNSDVAATKRNDALVHIKKQITFQQDQLKQLQNDRISFKRQQIEYLRKAENVPTSLKNNLDNNQKNIESKKESINSLQIHYRNTQAQYDRIITRLKALE
jgi:chromosome segregation ATPase